MVVESVKFLSRAQFYVQYGSAAAKTVEEAVEELMMSVLSEDVDDECNVSMSESDVETDANDLSEERGSSEDVTIVDSAAGTGPVTATAATPAQ